MQERRRAARFVGLAAIAFVAVALLEVDEAVGGADPIERPPEILRKLVAGGRTGKKSGRGFFQWEGDTPIDSNEP